MSECTFVPKEIQDHIQDFLDKLTEETLSGCELSIGEYRDIKMFSMRDKGKSLYTQNWQSTGKILGKLHDILYMLEQSQGKYYKLVLIGPCIIRLESEFNYFTIYDCQPEHKHIEGDYPYICNSGTFHQKIGNYDVSVGVGKVFLYRDSNHFLIGHAKPKKLLHKL